MNSCSITSGRTPTQPPSRSAWVKGPPQNSNSSASSPPSQVQSISASHSRRPSALDQGKEGISVPLYSVPGSVRQGSSLNFGSIDDASVPISSSPTATPVVRNESVKSFGSLPATAPMPSLIDRKARWSVSLSRHSPLPMSAATLSSSASTSSFVSTSSTPPTTSSTSETSSQTTPPTLTAKNLKIAKLFQDNSQPSSDTSSPGPSAASYYADANGTPQWYGPVQPPHGMHQPYPPPTPHAPGPVPRGPPHPAMPISPHTQPPSLPLGTPTMIHTVPSPHTPQPSPHSHQPSSNISISSSPLTPATQQRKAIVIRRPDGTVVSLESLKKHSPQPSTALMPPISSKKDKRKRQEQAGLEQEEKKETEKRAKGEEEEEEEEEEPKRKVEEAERKKREEEERITTSRRNAEEARLKLNERMSRFEEGRCRLMARWKEERNNSPFPSSAFTTARKIDSLDEIEYPEGINGPKAELNRNAKDGKFRYDREFLLQFMQVCKEKPPHLLPLDALGLKPVEQTSMTRGGPGRRCQELAGVSVSCPRSTSTGLGVGGGFEPSAPPNPFQMSQFSTPGSKLTIEERCLMSSGVHSASVGSGTVVAFQGECGSHTENNRKQRTRSKRGKKLQLLPRTKRHPGDLISTALTDVKKRIDEDVKEFFAVRNLEEADVYFTALAEEHRFRLVDKLVGLALESKEADVRLVAEFFARPASQRECSLDVFEAGFVPTVELLDDIAIDAPKAFEYMAIMLKGAGFDRSEERLKRIVEKVVDSDKLRQLVMGT